MEDLALKRIIELQDEKIKKLEADNTRLRQYEDAIFAALKGEVLVWNIVDTNCTVIEHDYWMAHLKTIDRLREALEQLVDEYIRNKGTKSQYVSCKTLKGTPDYWEKALAALEGK